MTNELNPMAKQTPNLDMYSMQELEEMALHVTLRKMGVSDPIAFLKEHAVESKATFKIGLGMSIVILSVKAKTRPADKAIGSTPTVQS